MPKTGHANQCRRTTSMLQKLCRCRSGWTYKSVRGEAVLRRILAQHAALHCGAGQLRKPMLRSRQGAAHHAGQPRRGQRDQRDHWLGLQRRAPLHGSALMRAACCSAVLLCCRGPHAFLSCSKFQTNAHAVRVPIQRIIHSLRAETSAQSRCQQRPVRDVYEHICCCIEQVRIAVCTCTRCHAVKRQCTISGRTAR